MYSAEVSPPRVLVVEDEPAIATMLAALLKQDGYRVSCAADGIEALDRLVDVRPDLILLDLGLPLLDGYEVCRRIKQDSRTRLTPVIILTAQDPLDTRLRVWELGADEFISKPVQTVELLARCQSLLRSKRLTDELETAQSVLFALARAVEAKSSYTHGHAERVAAYALLLADEVRLDRGQREILRQGALCTTSARSAYRTSSWTSRVRLRRKSTRLSNSTPFRVHGSLSPYVRCAILFLSFVPITNAWMAEVIPMACAATRYHN